MKTQKGFAPILFAIIAGIVLFAGGSTYYLSKQNKTLDFTDLMKGLGTTTPQLKNDILNTDSNTSLNLKVSNVSGYKTYKNEKYGFEFKYPSNLGTFKEYSPQNIAEHERFTVTIGDYLVIASMGYYWDALNDRASTLQELVPDLGSRLRAGDGYTIIDGKSAYILHATQDNSYVRVLFSDGKIFSLETTTQVILDQILPTIKFTK